MPPVFYAGFYHRNTEDTEDTEGTEEGNVLGIQRRCKVLGALGLGSKARYGGVLTGRGGFE